MDKIYSSLKRKVISDPASSIETWHSLLRFEPNFLFTYWNFWGYNGEHRESSSDSRIHSRSDWEELVAVGKRDNFFPAWWSSTRYNDVSMCSRLECSKSG